MAAGPRASPEAACTGPYPSGRWSPVDSERSIPQNPHVRLRQPIDKLNRKRLVQTHLLADRFPFILVCLRSNDPRRIAWEHTRNQKYQEHDQEHHNQALPKTTKYENIHMSTPL